MAAEEMLEGFLRRWRGKMGHRYASHEATKDAKEKDKDRAKAKGKEKAVDPMCQVRASLSVLWMMLTSPLQGRRHRLGKTIRPIRQNYRAICAHPRLKLHHSIRSRR